MAIDSTLEHPLQERDAHAEGRVAKAIEEQTARLPSDTFLWLAVGSMAVSAILQGSGQRHGGLFVGQWASAFLLFGVYNKLVKQLGSDRTVSSAAGAAR